MRWQEAQLSDTTLITTFVTVTDGNGRVRSSRALMPVWLGELRYIFRM